MGLDEYEQKRDRYDYPRVTTTEAIEHAAAMVYRFNRMYLRTVRGLLNMRRLPVVVQNNGGQVNVPEQQINLMAGDAHT